MKHLKEYITEKKITAQEYLSNFFNSIGWENELATSGLSTNCNFSDTESGDEWWCNVLANKVSNGVRVLLRDGSSEYDYDENGKIYGKNFKENPDGSLREINGGYIDAHAKEIAKTIEQGLKDQEIPYHEVKIVKGGPGLRVSFVLDKSACPWVR